MTNAEINLAVAERVMGALPLGEFHKSACEFLYTTNAAWKRVNGEAHEWSPATSIADAIESAEKWVSAKTSRRALVNVLGTCASASLHEQHYTAAQCKADTPAMAICRALLAATEGGA